MRSIQRAFVILFVLGISLAASARAQQSPVSQSELNDAQEWARHIHQTVPADELAAAAMTAELRQSDDPLLTLAAKYHLDAPDWLGNRIQAQAASVTLAALGDSISAGMASCASPYYYCPGNSWSTGDLPTSLRRELETSSGREVHGLLVSVPSLSMSAVPAEAFVVFLASFFGLNIERMTLLIGHNDPGVCGAPVEGQTAAFEKELCHRPAHPRPCRPESPGEAVRQRDRRCHDAAALCRRDPSWRVADLPRTLGCHGPLQSPAQPPR